MQPGSTLHLPARPSPRMDTPPSLPPSAPPDVPAPPPPPPAFTLPAIAWILWGLYAVAHLAVLFFAGGEVSPYRWGQTFGQLVATLLLPTLVAWIVWRLARRANTARTVTFLVVFGLMVVSQFVQLSQRAQTSRAMSDFQKAARDASDAQRAALARGEPLSPEEGQNLAAAASNELRKVAASSTGDERRAAEAAQAFTEQLLAANTRYNAALNAIGLDTFLQLSSHTHAAKIAARRKAVQDFAAANAAMQALQANGSARLRAELEQRRVSAAVIRSTLAGYEESSASRLPLIAKIRETDTRLAQIMLDFLDVAEGKLGKWELQPGGEVAFEKDEALTRYNALLQQFDSLATEQRDYQLQLAAASPKQ